MTEAELLQLLARGEDSRHQFKRDATNADGLGPVNAIFIVPARQQKAAI